MTDDPKPSNIVPFGKHKGRLIEEVLVDDPAYLQWLAGQEWFRAKFTILHQVIINRGSEPEETPEHNALQVKFLDGDFYRRFLQHLAPDLSDIDIKRLSFLDAEFEVDGVDVVLCAATLWKNLPASLRNIFAREHDDDEHTVPVELLPALKIELKPVVGDNYPAVLRQMRANKSTVLLVGAYNGTGATREQFVQTFATANIKVVFADEIEAA